MSGSVTKTGPGIERLARAIQRVRQSDVLVGIPADKATRKKGPINNASLLFVLSKGSPLRRIPATPILEPSITINQKKITPHFGEAAKAILNENPEQAEKELMLVGMIASNGAKRYFTEGNNWPPNAPSTLARKLAKSKDKDPDHVRRNIDTGALRRAITFVVRSGKG